MYSKYTNQQEEATLKEFKYTGSIRATLQKLGYPSPTILYRQYEHQKAGIKNRHSFAGSYEYCSNKPHSYNASNIPSYQSTDIKMDTLHRCFELGEDVEYVSRYIGYSRCIIYKWRRLYLEKGVVGLMSSKKNIKREPLASNPMQNHLYLKLLWTFRNGLAGCRWKSIY